ncbi:MAG TPA: alpha/beta fold hydrolase [Pyrinomonadaceae bacterium]|nr:alpha/beta fold hydrolase [Pyrinomonadaceae bacterium]
MSREHQHLCAGERYLAIAAAILAVTICSLSVVAQPRDGAILNSKVRAPLPAFADLDDFARSYFPRARYEEARNQNTFDILDIRYASDGLEVPGVLIRPKHPGKRKWPLIIYNRGGTGDYGRITNDDHACGREHFAGCTIVDLYLLAKSGFVIIASDYRFHGAIGKRDEWGGGDVSDVLNVIRVLRSLDYVDQERLYMLGVSRGGTMTYQVLKRGPPIRAAAVIAGASDLEALGKYRPEFVNGDEWYDGWAKVWPGYANRATELYRDRSPVYWADRLAVPILILHSRVDRLCPVDQALRMAAALQASGKVYALHIYEQDGHSLPQNREDRNRQIVEWFNKLQ